MKGKRIERKVAQAEGGGSLRKLFAVRFANGLVTEHLLPSTFRHALSRSGAGLSSRAVLSLSALFSPFINGCAAFGRQQPLSKRSFFC